MTIEQGLPSNEASLMPQKDKYLPKLDSRKFHNAGPLQAILDGFIDLEVLSLEQAELVFENTFETYSELLEGRKVETNAVNALIPIIQVMTHEATGKELDITFVQTENNPSRDQDIADLLKPNPEARKRVIILDDEDVYLVTGTVLSERDRVRPQLIDPHHPGRIDEKKNNWFMGVLKKGYWVLRDQEPEPERQVDVFP